jgi:hypothetical protein
MAWTTSNDPWNHDSKHKGIKAEQFNKGFKHGTRNCERIFPPFDNMEIDMKAVYIAQQLMLANNNQNRQCAAASTSALFHLAYQGGAKEVRHPVAVDERPVSEVRTVITNIAKPELSTHIHEEEPDVGGKHDEPVWEPLSITKPIMLVQATDDIQGGVVHSDKYQFDDKEYEYAFTHSDSCKLDTGEDYIKLPLSTYVRVIEHKGDKIKVERLGGYFSTSNKAGWIPIEKVTLSPGRFVPVHFKIAEKVCNEHVCLDPDLDKFPFLSAGPNSRSLCAEDIISVKDIETDNANVTVRDEHGKQAGFGKIPTMCLLGARVVPKPLDTMGSNGN